MNPSSGNGFGSFNNNGDGFSDAGFSSGNSFGSSGISSGGDIVLDNGASQKKKGPVIVLIVLVILAVLAGVGYVVWNRFSGGAGNENGGGGSSVVEAFNKYANYLLNGKESDSSSIKEEEMSIEESELYDEINNKSIDDREIFFSKLKEYNSGFYKTYNNKNDKDNSVVELLSENDYGLRLVSTFYSREPLMVETVFKAYLTGGVSEAEEVVNSTAELYKDDNFVDGEDFYSKLIKWGDEAISLIKRYDEIGCLNEGVDYECVYLKNDNISSELSKKLSNTYLDILSLVNENVEQLYKNVFLMKNYIYEGNMTGEQDK